MKKIKCLLLVLCLTLFAVDSAEATKLPKPLETYIKTHVPKARIRFDGVLIYPDGTVYVPTLPSYPITEGEVKIKSTYPSSKTLSAMPDVILFTNNYAYLKLVKRKDGKLSVIDPKHMPIEIITGILPQDLMVPKGFVLPDELKTILGDLKIPLISEIKILPPDKKTQTVQKPAPIFTNLPLNLKNKLYFVSAYDSPYITVFNSNIANAQYNLKLPNSPTAVKADATGQYLIIASRSEKHLEIVDVGSQNVIKQIELGAQIDELLVSKDNVAYAASLNDKAVFIIDLNTMKVTNKIATQSMPQRMALSEDESKLVFYDKGSAKIYSIELDNSYAVKKVFDFPNTYKLIFHKGQVYAISRTENELGIINYYKATAEAPKITQIPGGMFDLMYYNARNFNIFKGERQGITTEESLAAAAKNETAEIPTIPTGRKPIDMLLHKNMIFILCAQDNAIDVYDIASGHITNKIKLPISGFSKELVPVKGTNLVMITNVQEKKYVLFDLDKKVVTQVVNIAMPIKSITITDKMVKPKL